MSSRTERILGLIMTLFIVLSLTVAVIALVGISQDAENIQQMADAVLEEKEEPTEAAVEPSPEAPEAPEAPEREPEPEAPMQNCESEKGEFDGEIAEIVEPEATDDGLQLTEEEIEWLAITIYKEAGGDAVCDECRYRVADVILNRVADERFPDTIYDVLMQPRQYNTYSWDGGIYWPKAAETESEVHAAERAWDVARDVAAGTHSELYGEGYIWQSEVIQGSEQLWHCGICFGR